MAVGVEHSFLFQQMAQEMTERLQFVPKEFKRVMLMGPIAAFAKQIFAESKTEIVAEPMIDEEAIPFGDSAFDLILSAGTLDSVNDLPGALVQIRRALRADGLFLGTLFGMGSLQSLKSTMLEADGESAAAHVHPQLDLRIASDLMQRAGFMQPVCDLDGFEVRYSDWRSLVADLRAAGSGNALAGTRRYLGGDYQARLDQTWAKRAASDGKTSEFFNLLHLSGWARP